MLLFDLTTDRAASEGHKSHPDNANIRVELKFSKPLPEPITCILYLEYDNSVRVDTSRKFTIEFLIKHEHDEILSSLKDVRSFFGVFPFDMLPRSVTQSRTVIINANRHTVKCSQWLVVYFLPKS